MTTVVYTIGHSNRSIEEFLDLLQQYEVELLVDVRQFPGSRRLPHFNRDNLQASLRQRGIGYRHCKRLGGRRKPSPDSENTGWRVVGFQAYADYMQTGEFKDAVQGLIEIAGRERTVIMCSEAVWWRCHRRLIADALIVRGVTVKHILGSERADQHELTDFAKVEGAEIRYPSPEPG